MLSRHARDLPVGHVPVLVQFGLISGLEGDAGESRGLGGIRSGEGKDRGEERRGDEEDGGELHDCGCCWFFCWNGVWK